MSRGDGGELVGLGLDRLDHAGMLVADVGIDQLAGEVEIVAAVVVPQAAPLATLEHHRLERTLGGPGVEDAGAVQRPDVVVVHRSGS